MEQGHRGIRGVVLDSNWLSPGLDVLLHHGAIELLKSLAIDGFSELQRRLLQSVPSLAVMLPTSIASQRASRPVLPSAAADVLHSRVQLGHRYARGLTFNATGLDSDSMALHSSDLDDRVSQLNLSSEAVTALKQGLLDSIPAATRQVVRSGRIDLWQNLWCHGSSSVPTRCAVGSWLSIEGSVGGEGFFDQSTRRQRTFGKLLCIARISEFAPVVLIQLAHHDAVQSIQQFGGYSAIRFTLLQQISCIVVREISQLKSEILVHDCARAKEVGAPACTNQLIQIPAPLYKSLRRNARQISDLMPQHSNEPVFMRFDAILSSNRK